MVYLATKTMIGAFGTSQSMVVAYGTSLNAPTSRGTLTGGRTAKTTAMTNFEVAMFPPTDPTAVPPVNVTRKGFRKRVAGVIPLKTVSASNGSTGYFVLIMWGQTWSVPSSASASPSAAIFPIATRVRPVGSPHVSPDLLTTSCVVLYHSYGIIFLRPTKSFSTVSGVFVAYPTSTYSVSRARASSS